MTRFKLIAKSEIFKEVSARLNLLLKDYGERTNDNPDFVIVVGGDGIILNAERAYPCIPKITFRSSDVGSKCRYTLDDFEKVINKVLDGEFTIIKEPKLHLDWYNFFALNEIQLHNKIPISAVRFSIEVDNEMLFKNVIGDGVIIATPFGSSGYYMSVGGVPFKNCIGIALNNPSNYSEKPKLVPLGTEIKIKVHRKNGILIEDNNPDFIDVIEEKEYIIKMADKPAQFVAVK